MTASCARTFTALYKCHPTQIFRNSHVKTTINNEAKRLFSSKETEDSTNSKPQPKVEELFLDDTVQSLLKKLTGFQLNKVFRERPLSELTTPEYKLMTDEQLKQIQTKAIHEGKKLLQMPPVLSPRDNEKTEIISEDPEIADFDASNHVFVDITYGLSDRDRTVVVRETHGTLRTAKPTERDRVLQTFFPREGKMYKVPSMFEPNNLEKILQEGRYEYILDRAGVQYEPDDPEYVRVTERTYEHLNENDMFETLRSTRHYGGLLLYLTRTNDINKLLVEMLQKDMINDIGDLLSLYSLVNPSSKTANTISADSITSATELIQIYIENDSKDGTTVQLALQTYLDSQQHDNSDFNPSLS